MEKERLQEYAARVTQANRSELVVIIYEATLASIEEGKKYLKQGEIEAARHEIERARSMIINTTSGCSVSANATASAPSRACAATAISGWELITMAKPARTNS